MRAGSPEASRGGIEIAHKQMPDVRTTDRKEAMLSPALGGAFSEICPTKFGDAGI